jgi:NAD(P)-dependent dehydrogenase (short-subunit alcohol dehydrogenase family)
VRRALVVVGDTDGIGLALTRRLLQDGWGAVGVSRRPAGFEHERYEQRKRPAVVSYPRRMSAGARVLRLLTRASLR